jgi:hypothetical protein
LQGTQGAFWIVELDKPKALLHGDFAHCTVLAKDVRELLLRAPFARQVA